MLNAVIVDDEPAARRGMRLLLQAHSDIEILGEADSVSSACELLETCSPDVVFLDIEMPKAKGFFLMESLSHSHCRCLDPRRPAATSLSFTLSSTATVDQGFGITVSTAEDSATADDFTALTGTVVDFEGTAGESQQVSVTLGDDQVVEGTDMESLELE